MANDDPTKKDVSSEAHDTLVKSLESIKDLLLQSETKISAARESIAKAGITPGLHAKTSESAKNDSIPAKEPTPTSPNRPTTSADTPDVPLLDDVVIPGSPVQATATTTAKDEEMAEIDFAEIEKELQAWQVQTEKRLHDTLVKRLVRVEAELKKQLAKDIAALRKKLTRKFPID